MKKTRAGIHSRGSNRSEYEPGRGVDLFLTLGGLFLVSVRKSGVCQHWADFLSITIRRVARISRRGVGT